MTSPVLHGHIFLATWSPKHTGYVDSIDGETEYVSLECRNCKNTTTKRRLKESSSLSKR